MKILVYGAGVLGSIYAAHLKQAGYNVSILARGKRLADLLNLGIVLENALTGKHTITHVDVVETLEPEDTYDWVLVFVRKNQVASILPILAANHHTHNILFLVNDAAGAKKSINALGKERVLLGFAGAAGIRDGHVVRYVISQSQPVTLGELNGQVTRRLTEIASVFTSAGFRVSLCHNMDAWLKTHVALVSPVANALYAVGGSNYDLAQTPDALILLIRAIREGLHVLRALDIPVIPLRYRLLAALPEPIQVALLRWLFNTKVAEIAFAGHANAARDEMHHLAHEFELLTSQTEVPTPALDKLRSYLDRNQPTMAVGSSETALDFRGLLLLAEACIGLLVSFRLLRLKRKLRRRTRRLRHSNAH